MSTYLIAGGSTISVAGWLWLLSGPSIGSARLAELGAGSVVNLHALAMAEQAIWLGYFLVLCGFGTMILDALGARKAKPAADIAATRPPLAGSPSLSRSGPVDLLQTKVINGIEFNFYRDGSVEAETKDGRRRFPNLAIAHKEIAGRPF